MNAACQGCNGRASNPPQLAQTVSAPLSLAGPTPPGGRSGTSGVTRARAAVAIPYFAALLAACASIPGPPSDPPPTEGGCRGQDRKSTRLNSSHVRISYAVFCLKKRNPD